MDNPLDFIAAYRNRNSWATAELAELGIEDIIPLGKKAIGIKFCGIDNYWTYRIEYGWPNKIDLADMKQLIQENKWNNRGTMREN